MDKIDCLLCLYESYPSAEERAALVAALLREVAEHPRRAVLLCDRHFGDVALAAERPGDVL